MSDRGRGWAVVEDSAEGHECGRRGSGLEGLKGKEERTSRL